MDRPVRAFCVSRFDTGATGTVVSQSRLIQLGYDLAADPARHQISTGSSVEFVPRVSVSRIRALGSERNTTLVIAPTLPPTNNVDALLGLDFLRGQILQIDFR